MTASERFPTVRVAAVQAAPVMFDAAATIDKAIEWLEKAAADGVQLALFPETFVSAYPFDQMGVEVAQWSEAGDALYAAMYESAIEVPGPETEQLAEACARLKIHCGIGVNEREPSVSSSLYNSLLLFGPAGLLHKHRKLMPTNQERMFHGLGAGGDLKVIETEIGRIGGLICWENQMPLARYTIEKQAPQFWLAPTADFEDGWLAFARAISIESGAFVVTSPVFARPSDFPKDLPIPAPEDFTYVGGSAIIAPGGEVIAGPLRGEEGLVVADCDLSEVLRHRRGFDVSGHYARDDILLPGLTK